MTYEPTDKDRSALMRALAAAEQVAARIPHLPRDIKTAWDYRGGYSLDLYFHRGSANVGSFAHEFGVEVTAHPHGDNVEKTFTEAHAVVDGIAVRAWSLDDTVFLEGLTAEWKHQLNDPAEPPYAGACLPVATEAVPA
ncbi:hypothetical protein K378_01365 [Streptomyces sp. Amel2xB2]|uniref:hypothetical protein n=1 Tax=Streptomyces sp. Amel2xB2 TaxID=1305829 RepID=UPI000DBAA6C5|nr:hypothetical protein [Streptomyces sp. Amel2xB2]RAJ70200.1 hypothetical protein K378_01365 [Streptomyces sp. Amel2xB2]